MTRDVIQKHYYHKCWASEGNAHTPGQQHVAFKHALSRRHAHICFLETFLVRQVSQVWGQCRRKFIFSAQKHAGLTEVTALAAQPPDVQSIPDKMEIR